MPCRGHAKKPSWIAATADTAAAAEEPGADDWVAPAGCATRGAGGGRETTVEMNTTRSSWPW